MQKLIVILLTALSSTLAFGFGPTGHQIVGEIATGYLCDQARDSVAALLGGQSLADAGQWPDRIRGDPAWRHTAPWHYVNVADDRPVSSASGGSRGDVLQAVSRFSAELADEKKSKKDRANALRFLAHFVADVHQPLHIGRADDRGGNEIAVRVNGRRSNLHRVWDAESLLRADRRALGLEPAAQIDQIRALTAAQAADLQADLLLVWAQESRDQRDYVYAYPAPNAGQMVVLDDAYLAGASRISKARLSAAGVRLAGVLNGVFCPAAKDP